MSENNKAIKLAEIQKDTTSLVEVVNSLKIKTAEDMTSATQMLTKIVSRKKRVEELRVFFVKPLNDQVKAINLEFKSVSAPFATMEADIKNKMIDYRKIEADKLEAKREKERIKKQKEWEKEQTRLQKIREREAEKERKRLAKLALSKKDEKAGLKKIEDDKKAKEDEAAKEEFDFDDGDFQQSNVVHSQGGSVKVRKQWKFKITEPNKVPRKFLIVDEKLIRKEVRAGARVIAGVEIFEDEVVGVNT